MNIDSESSLFALVMAGGRGTRFWPESTKNKPKQYLNLTGGESLLSRTLGRFTSLVGPENRYIVTVKEQEELALHNSTGLISEKGLIFEPSGRNTAPCILLSLAFLEKQGVKGSDVVAIVPSDHVILNETGFRTTLKVAAETAIKESSIVTIGIRPNFPHTGYGYIHRGEEIAEDVFKVNQFKEKPNFALAKSYVSAGEYFWNAGMFVSTLKTLKEEFQSCSPETYKYYSQLKLSLDDEEELKTVYNQIPKESIDYAIMEKSGRVHVVAADFDWNDLGSWDALESVIRPIKDNTLIQTRDSFVKESKGNIIYAPEKFVTLIGIDDLIVVSNDKSLVVIPKNRSQEIKEVVLEVSKNSDLEDLL